MSTAIIAMVSDQRPLTGGAWVDVEYDGIPHSYVRAVESAGAAVLLLPPTAATLGAVARILDAVDGVFLPGGRDLDADLYGAQAHPANDVPHRLRDEIEIELVRESRRRSIPVLGVCRGMQVINVALGGTLDQHLADRIDAKSHRHVVGEFTAHPVRVADGTILATLCSAPVIEIASHHHQSVDRLGEGLIASAHAPDGVVEGLEAPADRFTVGVQWHSEQRMDPDGGLLLAAFIAAATEKAWVS